MDTGSLGSRMATTARRVAMVLVGCGVVVLAQRVPAAGAEEEPIHFSADSNTGSRRGDQIVVQYTGHVRITQGSMTLRAEHATYYEGTKRVELEGRVAAEDSVEERGRIRLYANRATYDHGTGRADLLGDVVAQDSTGTLKAPKVSYWRRGRKAVGEEGVRFVDRGRRLEADRVTYLGEEQRVVAQGRVLLSDSTRSLTVRGAYAEYLVEPQSGWVVGEPQLVRTAAQPNPSTTVTAERMEVYAKENRSVAVGDVRIVRGDLEARCDSATYLEAEDRFVLSGEPRAVQVTRRDSLVRFENEVEGREMEIWFADEAASQLVVSEAAQGTSTRFEAGTAPPQVSRVGGKTMRLFTENEQVREIRVEGNATSLYHLPPDKKGRVGDINEASGDTIRFFFEDAEVSRVRIEGGVIGQFRTSQNSRSAAPRSSTE